MAWHIFGMSVPFFFFLLVANATANAKKKTPKYRRDFASSYYGNNVFVLVVAALVDVTAVEH